MHNLTNNQKIQVKEKDDSVYFPIRFTHIIKIDNVWCWHGCDAIGTFTYEVSREATGWSFHVFLPFDWHVYSYYSKETQALLKDTGIRICTTFFEQKLHGTQGPDEL